MEKKAQRKKKKVVRCLSTSPAILIISNPISDVSNHAIFTSFYTRLQLITMETVIWEAVYSYSPLMQCFVFSDCMRNNSILKTVSYTQFFTSLRSKKK